MPKYVITADRYLYGQYVRASKEVPAIVEIPEGVKLDPLHFKLHDGGEVEPEKLKPAHAEKPIHPHSVPTSVEAAKGMPSPKEKDGKGKRASDGSPI